MNLVAITGNLGKEITLKYLPSGDALASFSLAVSRGKNKQGEYETDWINCVAFGKRAETLAQYTSKGSKLGVTGRIRTGSYEKDGRKVYTTDIMVDNFDFLDSKGASKPKKENVGMDDFEQMDDDDDFGDGLPF